MGINLTSGMMLLIGYVIGHYFGQIEIKDQLRKKGISFESNKKSAISRIFDYFNSKDKNRPMPNNQPQNTNQSQKDYLKNFKK